MKAFFYSFATQKTPASKPKRRTQTLKEINPPADIESTTEDAIELSADIIETAEAAEANIDMSDYVTFSDYAKLHHVSPETVSSWNTLKKLRGVIKVKGRNYVNKKSPPPSDGRKTRTKIKDIIPEAYKRPGFNNDGLPGSHDDLKKYMLEREGFSEHVADFILTYKEALYYRNNYYCEVNWDGQHALILDIKPDFYCKLLGKTNRQIILEDKESPVVEYLCDDSITDPKRLPRWDLHHVGGKKISPLATIPKKIHIDDEYSLFHPYKPQKSDIDRDLFNKQKIKFWQKYIEVYDDSFGYKSIEKISLRSVYNTKNKKRREAAIEATQKG